MFLTCHHPPGRILCPLSSRLSPVPHRSSAIPSCSALSHLSPRHQDIPARRAEPKSGKIKTRPAKATLLLNQHIRLGFSAFAGRDSHL